VWPTCVRVCTRSLRACFERQTCNMNTAGGSDFALRDLHHVIVGGTVSASDVHTASIFKSMQS
jgi:hypothetical protein